MQDSWKKPNGTEFHISFWNWGIQLNNCPQLEDSVVGRGKEKKRSPAQQWEEAKVVKWRRSVMHLFKVGGLDPTGRIPMEPRLAGIYQPSGI